ncbi:hypothetical protein [Dysosmobacter sp.]|uniref:hypothetical protein n=1 Tax=Dysosmobacter sp. TaxID=2591382 RepID=UPI002A8B6E08|nr:hypothetical protein [Dysosmobacter sp.]MDY3984714.1 hypothetical protein [Dysosmobacter sp.]
MDEKMQRMMEQLQRDPSAIQGLMQSRDGQALLRMLTQQDQGASLQRAAQSAVKGDTTQLARMVTQVMQSPDGAALVERINKAIRK